MFCSWIAGSLLQYKPHGCNVTNVCKTIIRAQSQIVSHSLTLLKTSCGKDISPLLSMTFIRLSVLLLLLNL